MALWLTLAAVLTGACGGGSQASPGGASSSPAATTTSTLDYADGGNSNASTGAASLSPTATATLTVDYAVKLRSSFGLRSDRPYVESIESDPNASRELGIALTPEEVKEVKAKRAPLELVLIPLTRELEADPTFAGLYLDQAAGGVLDIATTADVSHFAPLLGKYADGGVRFRVRRVSYTFAELKALQARVSGDFALWNGRGVQVAAAGVDVLNNRLEITVVALTPAARTSLETAYGPRVVVKDGEAPRRLPLLP